MVSQAADSFWYIWSYILRTTKTFFHIRVHTRIHWYLYCIKLVAICRASKYGDGHVIISSGMGIGHPFPWDDLCVYYLISMIFLTDYATELKFCHMADIAGSTSIWLPTFRELDTLVDKKTSLPRTKSPAVITSDGLRLQANEFYRRKQYGQAIACYTKVGFKFPRDNLKRPPSIDLYRIHPMNHLNCTWM